MIKIPSEKECYKLICEMEMMDHIVAHSIQVTRVAVFLTHHLFNGGIHLNHALIQAAALLHDITKTRSFDTGENHALTGGEFLNDRGYPQVGHLVRQHVCLDTYVMSGTPTEAEIVNYADKRVLHDNVVSLEERLDYILERYGKTPEYQERIRWTWKQTLELEDKIFNQLSFLPQEINTLMESQEDPSHLDFLAYREVCQ